MKPAQNQSQRVVLLAANTLQSCLLKDVVEQNLEISIQLCTPDRLNHQHQSALRGADVVVIDQSTLSSNQLERYQGIKPALCSQAKEVLINASPGVRQSELLKWQNLVGIFYINDDMNKLIKGFRCILEGEMWMSRKLLHEYVTFYRERFCSSTSASFTTLTKREQQIIKMLGDGASNIEIAEALFVSENTVKAHLHNTFKKLHVTNRVQALIWAKNNIAAREYVT
ncbi:LuxR C-terminal-related transcriptional regulator [Vibrio variabilis]|uniref:LuxR C-terminal-related transcriptional regulator n=1 Tax=Vibrio variabilis TaxID=990271 RepID=UPI000DD9AB19|nr:LuxR C-terminal-related transcriptional regulator [Vibrio variabilis]